MLKSRIPQIALEIEVILDETAELGAEMIERSAEARVPVLSGDLKDAIHVEKVEDGYEVVAGDGDNVFYGHMVEHGTSHSPPHPFLVPALEQDRDEIIGVARARLRKL